MLEIEPINAQDFRRALRVLNQIEPETTKRLREDLKSGLQPIANQVASAVPTAPALSGFGNNGRTGWTYVQGKVSFTPGKSRARAENLVSIRIDIGNRGAGPIIAELAGSRSQGKTASGKAMIYNLNRRRAMKGRGGRYAYAQFRFLRPDVLRIATEIINKTLSKLDRSLD